MTNITGYVIDIIKTPAGATSGGYAYISGATVSVGIISNTTSSTGYFNVSGVDTTVETIVVEYPRYETTEVTISGAALVAVWKNKGYT
jgi:glycine cleavage system aminomethyltransferase T